MSLKIFSSNRMESLVDSLAQVVRAPLSSPFTEEMIVVQSKGMQRWLAMQLACRFGVWANCRYPFPTKLVEILFEEVIPDHPKDGCAFHPDVMTWRLMELLQRDAARAGFEEIGGYLAGDEGGLKRLQLAQQIADTFDRYTIYRPELVLGWEAGEGEGWQPLLWRELTQGVQEKHRARLLEDFRNCIDSAAGRLPRRISLIGIPTLPPFHMEILSSIARHTEVNLFLLNPCREYWGKIVSERELARLEAGSAGDAWYETGNPLLASLGRQGREFFDSILGDYGNPEYYEHFEEPPSDSLLHAIQGDILELRDPDGGKRTVPADDCSVMVHSCHSPMREVEVLYDTLLSLFEADPSITPRDILVMTPKIEDYAPYISAVFDTPEGRGRIPYSIADRSLIDEGESARALLAILRLTGGRFGAATVLDVLEAPPVARRFGLAESDLETVRDWLKETNIRWGIDASQRREQGLPPFRENSWEAGLDRLLLGYALNGDGRAFFNGTLPYDDMEGSAAVVLGRFLNFCEALFTRCRSMEKPRPVAEWVAELKEILDQFLLPDQEGEREWLCLMELVSQLEQTSSHAGFSGALGIETMIYWLQDQLGQSARGFGFLTGGVTFCAMLPMRSIPSRVVALIGMNDGSFPRRNRPRGFDLMAASPRRGDRSQRDEDRYLFLEALLSTRKRLHISYVGQSFKDNSEIPPSVLVSELLDYLERAFVPADPKQGWLVRHPLQPFSPSYFSGDARLFSYSEQNFQGALAKLAPRCPLPPFISEPLLPWEDDAPVTLKALVDFLGNPSRELLRRRLGMRVERGVEPLEECEPFSLPPLVKYQLEQEIVAAQLRGDPLDLPLAVACGRGEIPPGECGTSLYHRISEPAAAFAEKVAAASTGDPLPPLDLELELSGGRIIGRIGSLRSNALVLYRYTKLKAKDLLRLWVEHLALNCACAQGYPRRSLFLASDAAVELPPLENSGEVLERLLALYRKGMAYPVRFFPETSLEYAKKRRDPKKAAKALSDARGKWIGSDFYPGECKDDHYRSCFGDEEPLDEEFMATALEVWEPLLGHQIKGK